MSLALSVAARHLSQRERRVWSVRKIKAFLLEEGGAAQAVTEGAAREQICIRVTLIRQGKPAAPSVFACGESSSLKDGAFSALPLGELAFAKQMTERASTQTSLHEVYYGSSGIVGCSLSLCLRQIQLPQRRSLPSLSLRDISPKGRDKFEFCIQK